MLDNNARDRKRPIIIMIIMIIIIVMTTTLRKGLGMKKVPDNNLL
jgi:hypothetical protein